MSAANVHRLRIRDELRRRKPRRRKLDEDRVRAIKLDLRSGLSQRATAAKHGVPCGTIATIGNGCRWGHVVI